jgi:hypothetical protein
MKSRPIRLATLASILCCAAASSNEIRWSEGAFAATEIVAAGKIAERCGEIEPREPVAWKFSADGPVSFNIHRHSGSEVIYTNRSYGTRELSGTFKPALRQEWCWMWTNETSQPITLRVEMKRE